MKYFVYVLLSEDHTMMYKGMTCDIDRRIKEHKLKQNSTTKSFGVFKIVLLEEYGARVEARIREKYLKSGVGREYLRSIVKNNNEM